MRDSSVWRRLLGVENAIVEDARIQDQDLVATVRLYRRTNVKFMRRFARIEGALGAEGRSPAEASLDEMEALWQAAKADAG